MQIKCIIKRKNGSTVEWNGKIYRFVPNEHGAHVCDVREKELIKRLLSITEAYEMYDPDEPDAADPEAAQEPPEAPEPPEIPEDLSALSHDELMDLSRKVTGRKPHPNTSDEKLIAQIAGV
jgi:hypothetical protein